MRSRTAFAAESSRSQWLAFELDGIVLPRNRKSERLISSRIEGALGSATGPKNLEGPMCTPAYIRLKACTAAYRNVRAFRMCHPLFEVTTAIGFSRRTQPH